MIAAIGIGYSLGPLLGASLAESTSDAVPAFAAAALFVVLAVVVGLFLPETGPATSRATRTGAGDAGDGGGRTVGRTVGRPCDLCAGWRRLLRSRGLVRVVSERFPTPTPPCMNTHGIRISYLTGELAFNDAHDRSPRRCSLSSRS
jgi:hypothetical protein